MIDGIKNFLLANKDLSSIILILVGDILVIVGWVIVFGLGLRQQKKQLQNNAKMKVYEELYNIKKELDECSIGLGLKFNKYLLPFLAMSWEKGDSPETNLKALGHWQKYTAELSEDNYKFGQAYLKLWNHSEMWIGVMPQLKRAKKELFEIQLNKLSKKISEHIRYLSDQSIKQFNWKLWSRKQIEEEQEKMAGLFNSIACGYTDDYLALIHNRLVSPILGYKKVLRENFANMDKFGKYLILTERGLEEVKNKK